MADPECPTHRSSENGTERHHPLRGRLVGALHPRHQIIEGAETRSAIQTMLHPHHEDPNPKDLHTFLHPDMRSSKSEPLVFSIGVSAPLMTAFALKTSGEIVTGPTSVKVHSAAELYMQDPSNPTSPKNTENVRNIGTTRAHPAAKSCSHGGKPSRSGNGAIVYGNTDDIISGKTGLVTYYETYMESPNDCKTLSNAGENKTEGKKPSPERDASGSNGNPLPFGKKCKTWSSFCVPQDKFLMDPSECSDVPKTEISVFIGNGDVKEEPEGICKSEGLNQEDNQRDDGSKSPCINRMDASPGNDDDTGDGRRKTRSDKISEPRAEEGPCGGPHQGPLTQSETTKPKETSSLAREKFWKYHKNCCDEYEPCQAAANVLRRLKTSEGPQKTKDVKQEPPSDEQLLEERTSLPPSLSKPSESQISTDPEFSSRKTCVSLPDLGVYGNHNHSPIPVHSPFMDPRVVQDEAGKENTSKDLSVCNTHLPVIDLPGGDIVSNEGLVDIAPFKTDLPNVHDLTEGPIEAGGGLYDVSETLGPTTPGNSAGGRNGLERDAVPCIPDLQVLNVQAQDDLNSDALPDINAPRGGMAGESGMSQVVPSSYLELPAINLQRPGPLKNKVVYNMSSSNLHLPIIDVSSGDNTIGQNPLQDDLLVTIGTIIEVQVHKKLSDVTTSLPNVHILCEDLPAIDVQSEALEINDSNPNDVQCNLSSAAISEPPEGKAVGEYRTDQGKWNVKAKSCPVLSAMYDRNPNCTREMPKSNPDSVVPVVRDPRNNIVDESDGTTFETSQEVLSKPVETTNTCSQESPLSNMEQELSPGGSSDINLRAETQLTPCGSYSLSIQDGDEISEWPKTLDFLKRLSTISLTSKYDILETSTVPQGEDDYNNSSVLDNGHSVLNSDCSTCDTSVVTERDHKAEDANGKEAPLLEEYTSENPRHTCSTSEETSERNLESPSEKQMTDAQRPPQGCVLDAIVMNNQTTNHKPRIKNHLEDSRKESSDTIFARDPLEDLVGHPFSSREDPSEHEDPSDDVNSSQDTKVQSGQLEVCESEDKIMANLESSEDQVIQNVRRDNTLTECRTSNLDVSRSHEVNSRIGIHQSEDFTYGQQSVKNDQQEDDDGGEEDLVKETHSTDPEDHLSLRSDLPRSKNVTRKDFGAQKQASKTFKTRDVVAPCIRDIGQDLKDYISTRLSRRPFQSVFPVSVKTLCLEDANKLNASSLEERPLANGTDIINPSHRSSSQPNSTSSNHEESSKKRTDATEYLSYLYARSPRIKTSQDDKTVDDIRVLANLQFCKVSGGFIVDAEIPETVQEPAEDLKSALSKPENLYIPPSKEELRADEELAILNVMVTLKKSLELSASYDAGSRTDT